MTVFSFLFLFNDWYLLSLGFEIINIEPHNLSRVILYPVICSCQTFLSS